MTWRVIDRRIGRAGSVKQRTGRQRQWDDKYGEGQWAVGYVVDGDFLSQEDAWEAIYYRSYEVHFEQHPEDLEELIGLAKALRNPHAEATTGVDLQVPAIEEYLRRHGLELQGHEVVDIGTWAGDRSHALSVRLSPLHIRCALKPKMTLEGYWQKKKCLAIWQDGLGRG